MKKIVLLFTVTIFLQGCLPNAEERYDIGYSDGYASGYNTTCKIRTTLVEGDWDNKDYSRGYEAGYSAGSYDCQKSGDK